MDNYTIGKTYKVDTQRKGRFTLRVEKQDETWVSGVITKGKASAMMVYNEKETGEEITLRKCLINSAVEE